MDYDWNRVGCRLLPFGEEMTFLSQTPQEEIQSAITQTGESAKQAVSWFVVIAVIVVLIILFGTKK